MKMVNVKLSSQRLSALRALKITRLLFLNISLLLTPSLSLAVENKTKLTPFGAEFAGNTDGSIPEWQGGNRNIPDIDKKLRDSQRLYQIDSNNLDQYKKQLPHGLAMLINQYPDTMKVNVYPSFRTAYYPEWVYGFAKKNITASNEINNSVTGTFPAPPFIHTNQGNRLVWNHLLTYKGVYTVLRTREVTRRDTNKYITFNSTISLYLSYYDRERGPSDIDQPYIYYLSKIRSPSRYAGGILLLHEQVNASLRPRQGWVYLPGQRRVMRIPGVDFDSPMQLSESVRFADEINLFNGSIDHYNWRTIEKKELVIPYNNIILSDKLSRSDFEDKHLMTKHHLAPRFLRYEKHRVWVVEGILKTGKRHAYKKRRFYIDEDSWLILLAENYDKNDELWRVSISYSKQYHQLPGVFTVADTFHDLKEMVYFFQGIEKLTSKEELPPKAGFMPSALRRNAIR